MGAEGAALGFHAFNLERIDEDHLPLVGRRVVELAAANRRGFAVPPAFVVLKKTFADFVRDTNLKLILPALENRIIARSASMEQLAQQVQEAIRAPAVPQPILLDVLSSAKALGLGNRAAGVAVTVRACPTDDSLSSASLERAVAVTRPSELEALVQACWASAYDAANIEAIREAGISLVDAAPSILISQTVPAETSGILFTAWPKDPTKVVADAVWGFHEALTEGKFAASRYTAGRAELGRVEADEVEQEWEYALGAQGVMVRREIVGDRRARPKLQRVQFEELAQAGLEIERHVGGPVGIEWAIQGGVVFILQIAPMGQARDLADEEAVVERYIDAARARDEALTTPREGGPAPRAAPAAPPPAPPDPAPRAAPAAQRLAPVIAASVVIELPPEATYADAALLPHAGVVVELPTWGRHHGSIGRVVDALAAVARGIFPRPLFVEIGDLSPAQYEALHERASRGDELSGAELHRLMPETLAQLSLLRAVETAVGAANVHIVAPFLRGPGDRAVVEGALRQAGFPHGEGAPAVLVFAELRSPSTLLGDPEFGAGEDGVVLRAGRFYKALLRVGSDGADAPDEAKVDPSDLAATLMRATRTIQSTGGTVLVKVEDESDLQTLGFFNGLGVHGYIAPLAIGRQCIEALRAIEAAARAPRRRRAR